jgi:cellulose 1,4-beta-cellobiosidase
MKFIAGEANAEGWKPSPNDPNAGTGKYGSCCQEMDIWEANTQSQAYTLHPCTVPQGGATKCEGDEECGDGEHRHDGICDKDGCDFATYRWGDHEFYGEGSNFTIDTTKKFTVVTQFITEDNSDEGNVVEVRRKYVQDGKVIDTPKVSIGGKEFDSITDEFCDATKEFTGDSNDYKKHGSLTAMSGAYKYGMVLVMSMWDDHADQMLWLDSNDPKDKPASDPGVARGPCPTSSGVPADVEREHGNATVTYSHIRYGAIDSTYGHHYKQPAEFLQ